MMDVFEFCKMMDAIAEHNDKDFVVRFIPRLKSKIWQLVIEESEGGDFLAGFGKTPELACTQALGHLNQAKWIHGKIWE
jgi:hypothetical protein